MAEPRTRVAIGFQGGPVLSVRVDAGELEALQRALEGDGWHSLQTDEGIARIRVDQVVYVQVDSIDQRVGFGA